MIGRKAWLSIDTPAGAHAVIYLLVQTAIANGLEPYRWLRRVLRDLSAAQTVEARLRCCCLGTCVQQIWLDKRSIYSLGFVQRLRSSSPLGGARIFFLHQSAAHSTNFSNSAGPSIDRGFADCLHGTRSIDVLEVGLYIRPH